MLVPGIFLYKTGAIHYVALYHGLIVKAGTNVLIAVHNAIGGANLGELRESVEKEFIDLDEKEKNIHFYNHFADGRFVKLDCPD